ncbi:MAG: DUF5018 domain-containing protein, partial [Candidatus Moranbacteria bacterium]|nr:DUF5018 domain-containing protein [Candidatus Moranbacteria bacterium]
DIFEKNEYVAKLGSLSSALGNTGKIDFSLSLSVDPEIYSYIINTKNNEPEPETQEIVPITSTISQVTDLTESEEIHETAVEPESQKSSEKLIYSFDIQSDPEIVGAIDYKNHTISLNIPSSIDVSNLIPSIIISDKAEIYPKSEIHQNFSDTIVYIVTAEDGSTQEYSVTAVIEKKNEPEKESASVWIKIFLGIAFVSLLVIITLSIFLILKRKIKTK